MERAPVSRTSPGPAVWTGSRGLAVWTYPERALSRTVSLDLSRTGSLVLSRTGPVQNWQSGPIQNWQSGPIQNGPCPELAVWTYPELAVWSYPERALSRTGSLVLSRTGPVQNWQSERTAWTASLDLSWMEQDLYSNNMSGIFDRTPSPQPLLTTHPRCYLLSQHLRTSMLEFSLLIRLIQ